MITVSVHGMEEVHARFDALVPKVQEKALRLLAEAVHDDVEKGADTHTKTGALRRSVFLDKMAEDVYEVGHRQQEAPHALFVTWGTKPHRIVPRTRRVLRWPSGNGFIFARFVNHPGYKGDNYLQRAADEAPRNMAAIIASLEREI